MADRDEAANDSEEGDLLPGSDECKKLTVEEKICLLQVVEEYPFLWDTILCMYKNKQMKDEALRKLLEGCNCKLTSDGIRKLLHSVCSSRSRELKKEKDRQVCINIGSQIVIFQGEERGGKQMNTCPFFRCLYKHSPSNQSSSASFSLFL